MPKPARKPISPHKFKAAAGFLKQARKRLPVPPSLAAIERQNTNVSKAYGRLSAYWLEHPQRIGGGSGKGGTPISFGRLCEAHQRIPNHEEQLLINAHQLELKKLDTLKNQRLSRIPRRNNAKALARKFAGMEQPEIAHDWQGTKRGLKRK